MLLPADIDLTRQSVDSLGAAEAAWRQVLDVHLPGHFSDVMATFER